MLGLRKRSLACAGPDLCLRMGPMWHVGAPGRLRLHSHSRARGVTVEGLTLVLET